MPTRVTIDMAPGAIWSSTRDFAAPVGKDVSNSSRYYQFRYGERIEIRGVSGLPGNRQVLVGPEKRPTDFTGNAVWMDTVTVSENWIYRNFGFLINRTRRLYQLERYSSPYSYLGVDRILDDGDVTLEVCLAFHHKVDGLFVRLWQGGSDTLHTLDHALQMLNVLQRNNVIDGYTTDIHTEGRDFSFLHLLDPFAGLIVVDNGRDREQCIDYGLKRTFTVLSPQRQVFVVEDDETFIHAMLSLKGPRFIHRDRSRERNSPVGAEG